MGYLLYILTLISFIMGIWRIGYALKHCHDPDFAIQLVLGFFLILASKQATAGSVERLKKRVMKTQTILTLIMCSIPARINFICQIVTVLWI